MNLSYTTLSSSHASVKYRSHSSQSTYRRGEWRIKTIYPEHMKVFHISWININKNSPKYGNNSEKACIVLKVRPE